MSVPQYMLLIATLLWVASCSEGSAVKSALSEWASVGLAVCAGIVAAILALT